MHLDLTDTETFALLNLLVETIEAGPLRALPSILGPEDAIERHARGQPPNWKNE